MPSPIVLRRLLPVLLLVDGTTALRPQWHRHRPAGAPCTWRRSATRVAMVSGGPRPPRQPGRGAPVHGPEQPSRRRAARFLRRCQLEAAFYLPRVRYNMTEGAAASRGAPSRLHRSRLLPPPSPRDAAGRLAMLAVTALSPTLRGTDLSPVLSVASVSQPLRIRTGGSTSRGTTFARTTERVRDSRLAAFDQGCAHRRREVLAGFGHRLVSTAVRTEYVVSTE